MNAAANNKKKTASPDPVAASPETLLNEIRAIRLNLVAAASVCGEEWDAKSKRTYVLNRLMEINVLGEPSTLAEEKKRLEKILFSGKEAK